MGTFVVVVPSNLPPLFPGADRSSNTLHTNLCTSSLVFSTSLTSTSGPNLLLVFRTDNESLEKEKGFRVQTLAGQDFCK